MSSHTIRKRSRPPHDFANEGEVSDADSPLVPTPSGREEGGLQDEQAGDFQEEVESHEPGGTPLSTITGGPQSGTPEETLDGLDPISESVRHEAEDHPVSSRREKI